MKLIYGIEDLKKEKIREPILTLGSFDGIHRGHQEILEAVHQRAQETQKRNIALTFDPHPQEILSPGRSPFLLTTTEEKATILENTSLDFLLVLPFDQETASTEPEVFVQETLVREIGVSEVFIGYDHRFGKNRRGDYQLLTILGEKLGFRVTLIGPVFVNGAPVSATRIRKAIGEGRFQEVSILLGRPYFFTGTVVEGSHRGKNLGVPTANLQVSSSRKLLPPIGIYTVQVQRKGVPAFAGIKTRPYGGMMSIGVRPTFGEKDLVVEVHLFDYSGDLYGEVLTVQVIERIRDELKFSSAEELKTWMKKDEETARKTLEAMNKSGSSRLQ